MSVPRHLCDADDLPVGWWVIYLDPFKIGLWRLFPRMVSRVLNTFDINLAQINPNEW